MDQSNSNTIETSRKLGKHLTLDEREMIQALHQQGYSLRDITTIVGCAHTTIYYEIRRGTPKPNSNRGRKPQYTAKRGQKAYEEHRKHSRKPLKIYCDDCEPFIQWMVAQVRDKRWSIQHSPSLKACEPRCILHIHTAHGNALRMNATMAY